MYKSEIVLRRGEDDVWPLSPGQIRALAHATGRELAWGHRCSTRDIRRWRRAAEQIPDVPLREDAVRALETKRGNVVGAGLFSVIPKRRNTALVRVLTAYQAILDYLDDVHERHMTHANGVQLHQALVDALDPERPLAEYYLHHPWRNDGGYLRGLVEQCRQACPELPAYETVKPFLVREATRSQEVLPINHDPDPERRDRGYREWAERELGQRDGYRTFEFTAAASGQLVTFGLLAITADPDTDPERVGATYDAYWPRLPLILAMLDSLVDLNEDVERDKHRYLSHYGDLDEAVSRLATLIPEAARSLRALPDGHLHSVVASCMVSYYLSKDSIRTPALQAHRRRLIRAGGSLTRGLAPTLRTWRIVNSQQSA